MKLASINLLIQLINIKQEELMFILYKNLN